MARTKPIPLRKRTPPPPWPSEEQIRLFSNLPQEVIRRIFEIATEDWQSIKPNLALVSHSLRKLVESRLYEHLYFRAAQSDPFALFYRTFCERDKSTTRSPTFYRENVRTFEVQGPARMVAQETSDIYTVIKELVGLGSLIFTGGVQVLQTFLESYSEGVTSLPNTSRDLVGSKDQFPYKNLRKLGFSAYSFNFQVTDDGNILNHRIFKDITHLALDVFTPYSPWESFTQLSALTHLSFDFIDRDDTEGLGLDRCITTLLNSCPRNLQIIIFPCIDERYLGGYHIHYDDWDYKRDDPSRMRGMLAPYVLRIIPELPVEDWGQYCTDPPQNSKVSLSELHLMWRMALGLLDPRIVAASCITLPSDLVFRDEVIDHFAEYYQFGSVMKKDRWSVAEEIVKKRRSRLQTTTT